jgi:hypothetical protein
MFVSVRFRYHVTVGVVMMIVFMPVHRDMAPLFFAEQLQIGRMAADQFGRTGAADMMIHTDHPIGGRQHQMQIVRYHQNGTVTPAPDRADQIV